MDISPHYVRKISHSLDPHSPGSPGAPPPFVEFPSLLSKNFSSARPPPAAAQGVPAASVRIPSLRCRYITKDSPFGLSFVYLRERRDSNPRPLPRPGSALTS